MLQVIQKQSLSLEEKGLIKVSDAVISLPSQSLPNKLERKQ